MVNQLKEYDTITEIRGIPDLNTDSNRLKLATILMSEVSIGNYSEKIAVGNTVLNRMNRNGTSSVSDVARAYALNQTPTQEMIELAGEILSGGIPDNTGGATHYYSPKSMPREGSNVDGFDVKGGLEKVSGLNTKNYRPAFSTEFIRANISNVREHLYKFYIAPGNGRVR